MTMCRRLRRHALAPALVITLAASLGGIHPALGQQKDPPQKEVTDGFFDVPDRDPSEIPDEIGLPAYLVTAGLAGLAIFLVCKSARRS